jgi:hypothetical protein
MPGFFLVEHAGLRFPDKIHRRPRPSMMLFAAVHLSAIGP